jgi:hypothetical protein
MLKDLIKIADSLDAAGHYEAAAALDGVIMSLASDKPDWIANPDIGLKTGEKAAVGYAEIDNDDLERGVTIAQEQAKAKLRAALGPATGYEIRFDEEFEHYEPNLAETPEKVWVRAVAEKPSQG